MQRRQVRQLENLAAAGDAKRVELARQHNGAAFPRHCGAQQQTPIGSRARSCATMPKPRMSCNGSTSPLYTSSPNSAAGQALPFGSAHCIDALPDGFRALFVRREIEALSIEETAGLPSLSPATGKTKLHRARRLLRQALDAQLASVLSDTFPFDGERCRRTTDAVLTRLGLLSAPTH